jgi:cytochrome c553
MRLHTIAAAFAAAVLCASLVMAQDTNKDANKPATQTQDDDKPTPGKTYVPGIEQFMGVIQREHVKLWFAARTYNWELADFQIGEIKELLGDIQDLYPKFKSLPFADMIDAVIVGPIAEVEKAVAARNADQFSAGFDNLTTACNSCHEATGLGFVVIQRPTTNPFSNQNFSPRKK